ncbi:TnsD family Tn7-like transposition protein [Paenibacillus sp. FSL K6-3166]|uniref:TnsD family Tn7-like transposition protein n=1 Tax=unclassified Paenibacillus TaxID=185978 RepID=UPI000B9FD582|nr:TnsD family Tn7-like transposition protein [Paenibacillus sp. VTT E-133291]OZQ91143.1 hypothetical protein CA598_12290 [Paenibacillus sp. VTT E-133291]
MIQLLTFPEPLPDEDFRSLIYRYHLRSGNSEIMQSKHDLFGVRSYKHTFFPKNLQVLLDRLPEGHPFSLEQILNDYTWYGLYRAFFTVERHKIMLKAIMASSPDQRNSKGQPANTANSIISSEMKYCPLCIFNDYEQYGEIYLHRQHQISFLKFCPYHNVQLIAKCRECDVLYGSNETGQLLRQPYCKNGHAFPAEHIDINQAKYQLQIELMEELLYVRYHYKDLTALKIQIKLYQHLFQQGYITISGTFLKKKLFEDYKNWHTIPYNDIFDVNNLSSLYFQNSFLKPECMPQFINFYLLLAKFLNSSLREILLSKKPYATSIPLGHGPWTCLNPECNNKGQPIIRTCTRKTNDRTGLFLIRYNCQGCGYESLIQGFVPELETLLTSHEYVSKGSLMHNEATLAYKQIAVGVDITALKNKKRAEMTELLNNHLFQNRKDIIKKADYLYFWLIKNDKEWLEERIPPKIPRDMVKLDFKDIDKQLQLKIRNGVSRLDLEYKRPIKTLTILNLLEPSDANRFRHYHERLPLSKMEINKYVESSKDFLIRSIPRNYAKLVKLGYVSMTVKEFKVKASISYHLHGDEDVDKHIRNFLQKKGVLIDR